MTRIDPKQFRALADAGLQLIPLRRQDKRPANKDWVKKPYNSSEVVEQAIARNANVGVRLTAEQLILDWDPRNDDGKYADPSLDAFTQFVLTFGFNPDDYPQVKTGSGGLHIYMRKPADLFAPGTVEGFPGVEFKSVGRQVVAPGSVHPNGNRYELVDLFGEIGEPPLAPQAFLDSLKTRSSVIDTAPSDDSEYEPEQIERMLEGLDVEEFRDHEEWLRLMQSCHYASGGQAREEFLAWSTSDPVYSDHDAIIGRRWDSLRSDREGPVVTGAHLRSLLFAAKRDDLIPRISAQEDFDDDLEEKEPADGEPPHDVLANWVFVADAFKFVRRSDLKKFKPDQWNSLFASLKPKENLVTRVYKGKTAVKRFESLVFIPGQPEELDGSRYNIWRPSGVTAKPGDVSVFTEHLERLLPDETERGYLLDYLHYLVVRPEVKIRFALLLQGLQGTGKSAIGALLRRTIGDRNVSLPSNHEVNSNWTAWQEGAQLAIIEELMTSGRMELANRLKPVITDDFLRIEDKHQPLYSIPNHLNLLCFTNHKDAVRLESGDRRWMVLFSPMEPEDGDYYDRLFDWINSAEGPAAFRYMLEQRKPALNPNGRAPATDAKTLMRAASRTQIESEVHEWSEGSSGPFAHDLFTFKDATEALSGMAARSTRNVNAALSKALTDVGAEKHTRNTNTSDGLPSLQLYSIRDHERWKEEGPVARCRAYLKMREDAGLAELERFD